MSYQIAYTTHFRSLDNTLYEIAIAIDGYAAARPIEIRLEGDEPCIIEWQETGKTDVVQSSTCTLRVSNESDRQMVQLMSYTEVACLVSRDGKPYWFGHLDDSIYEEPYSFAKAYVTEIIFSDFGILNRIPFTLTGKQSVDAIVCDCLDSIGYGNGATINLYTSLLDPKTQQPITLDMLYLNADRFDSDGKEMTRKRDVLEDTLRSLGLRIMQKNGQIYIYDIEYLRDNNIYNYIVWKGTDAYLRGSEIYRIYEVDFEHDAVETLAEEQHNLATQTVGERYFAKYYDEDAEETNEGFFIKLVHPISELLDSNGRVFKTRSNFTDSDDIGYAWRVRAHDTASLTQIPPMLLDNELVYNVVAANPNVNLAGPLFNIESGYLPVAPGGDKYQLRVNLDLLFSPKLNPFEGDEDWNVKWSNTIPDYDRYWKKQMLQVYVPVKLELLDEEGNVLMHYRNIWRGDFTPLDCGQGVWESGAAVDFGDMMLAYYNDGLEQTALDGWATNKQTMLLNRKRQSSLYKKRKDGEYVPLPPVPGILKLTVSNCVFSPKQNEYQQIVNFGSKIGWQMYRNAMVVLVKNTLVDDGINTDAVHDGDYAGIGDRLSETLKVGCWSEDVPPSSRGLLYDGDGNVWHEFVKNGRARTLQEHRVKSLEDQTYNTQPVLSGTAELDIQFCAKREGSTSGVFLVTALRQDLHEDLEEVTMARIANVGGFVYEFKWSDPYCAKEEEPYNFAWSSPVCAQEPGPYKFEWSNPTCVTQYTYFLEWEEMQTYD